MAIEKIFILFQKNEVTINEQKNKKEQSSTEKIARIFGLVLFTTILLFVVCKILYFAINYFSSLLKGSSYLIKKEINFPNFFQYLPIVDYTFALYIVSVLFYLLYFITN